MYSRHEGAGIVVETGKNVKDLCVGDHVIPLYTPECGSANFVLIQRPTYAKLLGQLKVKVSCQMEKRDLVWTESPSFTTWVRQRFQTIRFFQV